MKEREAIRKKVWGDLRRVARPDSRFHWDFTAFIPDYEGSDLCAGKIRDMDSYRQARTIFVTPDNNLAVFRANCLADQKAMIVPTYGLGRGFWQITPADAPPGAEEYASTLDGLERFARPYPVESVPPGDRPTLIVTGASVINDEGVRISASPSYFDLEWLILQALGIVTADTPIIASVHDCQVVEWPCEPQPYDAVVDWIVTPSRVIQTGHRYPKPDDRSWEQLPWSVISEVPLLRNLYQQKSHRVSGP